jgi:hypothetical protein
MADTTAFPMLAPADEPRPFAGLMAGLLMVAAAVFLFAFKDMDPYVATVICGGGGFFALIGAIYIKYRGRLHFNAEIAFLMGMSLQYLIAPTLCRIISNDFTDAEYRSAGERALIKDGDAYPGALMIVVLYAATFLLTSAAIPLRRSPRLGDGRLALRFTRRSFIVLFLLTLQLWITRLALLASGAYYHMLRTRFDKDDPRYSGWAQIDSGVGMIVEAFLWSCVFTKNLRLPWVLAYTLVDLVWCFSSGTREKTLMVGIVILVTFIVYRNRIPWKMLALLAVPVVMLIGFMDYYRYAIRQYGEARSLNINHLVTALARASSQTEHAGLSMTLQRGLGRLNDLESIARIYVGTPREQPYLNGETYLNVPSALIPRAIWPDKPQVNRPLNDWFFTHEKGSSPITTAGEGWLNFGVAGVVFAGFLSALILRFTERFMIWRLTSVAVLPVYVSYIAIMSRIHTQPIDVWVASLIKGMFLAFIVSLVTKPARHPQELQTTGSLSPQLEYNFDVG